jgi:predicted GIY-YIG superfamily endonuclease
MEALEAQRKAKAARQPSLSVAMEPKGPNQDTRFFYFYILQSKLDQNRFYTGFTEDLKARLQDHNWGKNPYTAKLKPWRIKTAIAFEDRQRALDFESYLKTPSGRAFAKKRL